MQNRRASPRSKHQLAHRRHLHGKSMGRLHTHVLHGISRHSGRQRPHAHSRDFECSSGILVPPFDMVKVQKMPGNLQIMIFVNNVHSHSINIELSYNLL